MSFPQLRSKLITGEITPPSGGVAYTQTMNASLSVFAGTVGRACARTSTASESTFATAAVRAMARSTTAAEAVFTATMVRTSAESRGASLPVFSGTTVRAGSHAVGASLSLLTASSTRQDAGSRGAALPGFSGTTARAEAHTIGALLPLLTATRKTAIARAIAAVEAAFNAVATIIKEGSVFSQTVSAAMLAMVAAVIRQTSDSKASASHGFSAASVKAETRTGAATQATFSVSVQKALTPSISANTSPQNAGTSRQTADSVVAHMQTLAAVFTAMFQSGLVFFQTITASLATFSGSLVATFAARIFRPKGTARPSGPQGSARSGSPTGDIE